MRLEIIVLNEKSNRLLSERPPKDGNTQYACGLYLSGSWAGRLEEYDKFCNTPIGKYILRAEERILNPKPI